ncbi:AtaL-like protein [Streptomyces sp. NPDC059455]|uniref:AtaL-like protein n=1 Tax=Streptomyces sp. NPDC059455 TaxID=3346837 RepID=UPI0036895509
MAIIISHSALINDSTTENQDGISYDALWETLLRKAEYPVDYVAQISECRIVERYPDGFLREAVFFGKDTVRERVTPRRDQWRIDFEVMDDPRFTAVINELDQDPEGRFRYTVSVVLSERSAKRITEVEGLLAETDAGVLETARQTAETLRKVTLDPATA